MDDSGNRVMALLAPHIRQAIALRCRLDDAERQWRTGAEALGALSTAVIAVGEHSDARYLNGKAAQFLRAGRGLEIRGDRVVASSPAQAEPLRQAVRRAARASAGRGPAEKSTLILRAGRHRPVSAVISPLHATATAAAPSPLAMIFVDTHPAPDLPAGLIATLYGLSAAEARLVVALASGQSLTEYANAARIAQETARSQLKSVFAKTNTARQVDIVRLVLNNPVLRLATPRGW